MKKFLLLAVMAIFFASCTSEGGLDITKSCWVFDIQTTVTMMGNSSTSKGTLEKCDMTESEANSYMKELNSTITTSSGGYTMVSKTTCTSKHKK